MRKLTALLVALLLPVTCFAEGAWAFCLSFQLAEDISPALQPVTALLAMTEVTGTTAASADGRWLFQADMTLGQAERASTAFTLWGKDVTVLAESPLLGTERLKVNRTALLEFCLKMNNHLGLPLQYPAMLLPTVTEDAWAAPRRAAEEALPLAGGTVPLSDVASLCDTLTELSWTDSPNRCWWETLSGETQLLELYYTLLEDVAAWCRDQGADALLTIEKEGDVTRWTAAGQPVLTADADGWQFSLADLYQTGSVDCSCETDGDGLRLNLMVGDAAEPLLSLAVRQGGTVQTADFRLHVTLSGSCTEDLTVPRHMDSGWTLVPLAEGDSFRLDITTEGDSLRLSCGEEAALLGYIRLNLSPAAMPDSWPDTAQEGVNLFSLQDDTLTPFVQSVARPLLTGLLPLAAQAPVSTCAAVMDLLEAAGIFSLESAEDIE